VRADRIEPNLTRPEPKKSKRGPNTILSHQAVVRHNARGRRIFSEAFKAWTLSRRCSPECPWPAWQCSPQPLPPTRPYLVERNRTLRPKHAQRSAQTMTLGHPAQRPHSGHKTQGSISAAPRFHGHRLGTKWAQGGHSAPKTPKAASQRPSQVPDSTGFYLVAGARFELATVMRTLRISDWLLLANVCQNRC
jgi:hypothetical protein